jgi:hypothetical protein
MVFTAIVKPPISFHKCFEIDNESAFKIKQKFRAGCFVGHQNNRTKILILRLLLF